MTLKPPRLGEILAGAAGAVLLASLFLPWYRERVADCIAVAGGDCPSGGAAGTAWQSFAVLDILLLLVGLAGVGLLVAQMTQATPAVAVAWAGLATPVASVAVVWVLVRILAPPSGELEPLFSLLGLGAVAGVTVGCLLSMRDDRPTVRSGPGARSRGPEPIPLSALAEGPPDGGR